jgi:hypothetical protein
MLGHSEGTNDVASVVTVLIVPNLPCAYEWRPFPVSSRLEYVVMSVMLLLDAMDWFVVVMAESAMDTRTSSLPKNGDSPTPEAISERSDGRERKGERGGIGGTSSRSLVPVGVSYPSVSTPPPPPKAGVTASPEDEETNSRLAGRNVGRPTPAAEGGDGDDVHCCLVLFRVVRGERGEFDGDGECECADEGKLGDDMIAREEEVEEPVRYGEPRGGGDFTAMDVLIGLGTPSPPRENREFVCTGVSAHLMSAMIVFATRASESEVASIRSSRRKRSSGEKSLVEQDARNLVTLDMRSLPSSRGSIRAIDPGRNLFINLMRVVDRERGHQYFAKNTRSNQGEKKSSLAKNVTIPQRL